MSFWVLAFSGDWHFSDYWEKDSSTDNFCRLRIVYHRFGCREISKIKIEWEVTTLNKYIWHNTYVLLRMNDLLRPSIHHYSQWMITAKNLIKTRNNLKPYWGLIKYATMTCNLFLSSYMHVSFWNLVPPR